MLTRYLSIYLLRAGRPRDKVVWDCTVLKWQGGLPFPWTWRLRGSPPVCISSCCLFFFLTGLLEEELWYAERVATRSRYGTWCCVWITSYINMHQYRSDCLYMTVLTITVSNEPQEAVGCSRLYPSPATGFGEAHLRADNARLV